MRIIPMCRSEMKYTDQIHFKITDTANVSVLYFKCCTPPLAPKPGSALKFLNNMHKNSLNDPDSIQSQSIMEG